MYSVELENQKDKDTFLYSSRLPQINQDYINNLNRPIAEKEIDIVAKWILFSNANNFFY